MKEDTYSQTPTDHSTLRKYAIATNPSGLTHACQVVEERSLISLASATPHQLSESGELEVGTKVDALVFHIHTLPFASDIASAISSVTCSGPQPNKDQ